MLLSGATWVRLEVHAEVHIAHLRVHMDWRSEAKAIWNEGYREWDGCGVQLVAAAIEIVKANWSQALSESDNPEQLQALMLADEHAAVEVVINQVASDTVGELVDKEGAAKMLACSVNHINNLVASGDIKAIKVGKSLVRFNTEHLRDFIRRGGLNG